MKTKKIIVNASWHTEFSFVIIDFIVQSFKVEHKNTQEETFQETLKVIPKKVLKTWESMEFENIEVRKDWLLETDFDFTKSHQVLESN